MEHGEDFRLAARECVYLLVGVTGKDYAVSGDLSEKCKFVESEVIAFIDEDCVIVG